ncbi:class I mannose-6-phosphate isomerase [Microbacterium sp. JB110]|uniref:class I mannose-6-phosphate isomerase n=1 Tax=Microbacterium sp. JB110 TaxID=2024477 RepID=UPI00111EA69E|nr:class I mannose-6-phosphate isomerase [Microbacterium sp. JB110]
MDPQLHPRRMAPNLIDHFYRGGDRIASLRGIEQSNPFQPEEWLAATVPRAGEGETGLASTTDGELLRDLVAADPEAWIGGDHSLSARPSDTGVLVKLLDARQRLPVHVHPGREFALSHLDCPYGKTESWLVLDAEPGSAFHLGWSEAVDPDELDRRRDAQDSEWMLSRMNRFEAHRGMGVLVPAGTVHAIDSGIFVAEVQEPTDFSLLLEWSITTSTREESHLDLGFDTAMGAVSTSALTDVDALVRSNDLDSPASGSARLLPPAADAYFRLDRAGSGAEFDAGFAVVLAVADTELHGARGESVSAARGDVLAVPAAFGPWRASGAEANLIVHRPGSGWPQTLGDSDVA